MVESQFKKYYAIPEWREKHLTYRKTKVPCPESKFVTSRANMTRHKRSRNHISRMKEIKESKVTILEEKLKKLKKKIKKQNQEDE